MSAEGTEGAHRLGKVALSFRARRELRHQEVTQYLDARVSFSGVFSMMVLKNLDHYVSTALLPLLPPCLPRGLCEPGRREDFRVFFGNSI